MARAQGFLGDIVRITPKTDSGTPDLETLVIKMPTSSINRRLGQIIGVYEREIRFYQELQANLSIRTPACYYSAMDETDPEQAVRLLQLMNRLPLWLVKLILPLAILLAGRGKQRYVLLLEDLGQFRIGDQLAGCTVDEARLALDTLARLHAGFFNQNLELARYPWVIPFETGARFMQVMVEKNQSAFRRLNQESLSKQHEEILDWLVLHTPDFIDVMKTLPATLLHGDYRLDNLCFDDDRGELIVFDWQTLLWGPVGVDLAYFITSSAESGADGVNSLLDYYRAQMHNAGIELSAESVRNEYEMGLLATIHRLVLMAADDVEFGEGRGPELLGIWLTRIFREAESIDLDGLLKKRSLERPAW